MNVDMEVVDEGKVLQRSLACARFFGQYALAFAMLSSFGLKLKEMLRRTWGGCYDLIDERVTSSSCRWFGQNVSWRRTGGRVVTLE